MPLETPDNYGLVLAEHRPKDWWYGSVSGLSNAVRMPDLNWRPHLPMFEPQNRKGFETYGCVTFASTNSLETQIKFQYGVEENFSDSFTVVASGTVWGQGNGFWNVAESLRKNDGFVPESVRPFLDGMGRDEFYRPLTADERAEGLAGFRKYRVGYEFVPDDADSLVDALARAPIVVGIHAYGPLVDGVYQRTEAQGNHAVLLCDAEPGKTLTVYDHYDIKFKKLAWDTRFWGALRYSVAKAAEPLPPAQPAPPMTQLQEGHRYFLADAGGRTLFYLGGKLRLDDLAKGLDQFIGRNDGALAGKNHTVKLDDIAGVPLFDLNGNPTHL